MRSSDRQSQSPSAGILHTFPVVVHISYGVGKDLSGIVIGSIRRWISHFPSLESEKPENLFGLSRPGSIQQTSVEFPIGLRRSSSDAGIQMFDQMDEIEDWQQLRKVQFLDRPVTKIAVTEKDALLRF